MTSPLHALLPLFLLSGLLAGCQSFRAGPSAAEKTRQPPLAATTGSYQIQIGDQLSFDFAHHPEYSKQASVRADGRVTLPLVGDVMSARRTPQALSQEVERLYRSFLRYPTVSVALVESPSQVIYVGGEVKNPGMYDIGGGKTALQAILAAGGTNARSNLRQVFLLRENGRPQPKMVALNLRRLLRGDPSQSNFPLQAKDILVVPPSKIATANDFVDQYLNKLIPFSKSLGVSYFIGSGIE